MRVVAAVVLALGSAWSLGQGPGQLNGLKWRNIGPFRAGRVSAVAGVPGNPAVYYMGLPQGGVWKTTSAGQTWFPVFDAVRATSAIGSLQVAPSNPAVVYAGTGEISGGSPGAGIYRSDDAGATWRLLGLEQTKIIPAILVDPKDPNTLLVAALGGGAANDVRGVYRSTDGGKTWTKTLYVDDHIGIQHIAWAYDNPGVVFALSQRVVREPGRPKPGEQLPTGTDIFRSADEGQHWTKLATAGLPRIDGRCTIAVAQGTNSQRVFLIGVFGFYRSDDGGQSWRRMAGEDRRIANGQGYYTSGVYVDPKNPDVVYTLATCMYRSLDGGKSFEAYKGAPGGDDPQQLWIDPMDGSRMLLGGDQGAVVSLDSGATWGSWYNQPTGQFYHIGVDNQWPYWVYGTQQDSGAIGTGTRGNLGEITPNDWTPHPGSEGGPMLVDPLDPKITYCFGPGGFVRVMFPSGQWTPISPPRRMGEELRGPSCFVFSAADPHEMLAGAQFLISTRDRGASWQRLSDDLTVPANDKTPASKRQTTISAIAASPLDSKLIWIGTGNGLLRVTRDHGKTWDEVSVAAADRRPIGDLEASGTNKAEAYGLTSGPDGKARILRTRDYGKTWVNIAGSLPQPDPFSFPPVLRSDRKKAGLLFLTSGQSVFFSSDDGDHWQPLNLNLPVTALSDLVVHGDDLVLATYGRGIWILDDFSPLREIATSAEPVHFYKPATAIRVRRSLGEDTPFPPEVPHAANPPLGAVIDYSLSAKPTGVVTLEIVDRNGQVIRHMSSIPAEPYTDPKPAVPDFWFESRNPLPTEIGLNRVTWNLRYDTAPAVFHDPSYYGEPVEHATPFAIEGPLVPPGVYTARLTVDGKTYSQQVTVAIDPRSPGSQRDIEALHEVQMRLYLGIKEAWEGYRQVSAVRTAIAAVMAANPADEVAKSAKALSDKLAAVEGSEVRGMLFLPESTKDFIGLNQHLLTTLDGIDAGDIGPTEALQQNTAGDWAALKAVADQWRSLCTKDLADLNTLLARHNLKPIQLPTPTLIDPPAPPKRYLPPPEPAKTPPGG